MKEEDKKKLEKLYGNAKLAIKLFGNPEDIRLTEEEKEEEKDGKSERTDV